MSSEPVVVSTADREWETWPADQVGERGTVWWKTLISAGVTPSDALTLGVARVPAGGALRLHRHTQAEVYLVLEGTGVVTVDDVRRPVGPGDAVFLPGDALHGVECTGAEDLRLAYVLAADGFEDVEYVFPER